MNMKMDTDTNMDMETDMATNMHVAHELLYYRIMEERTEFL